MKKNLAKSTSIARFFSAFEMTLSLSRQLQLALIEAYEVLKTS